MQANKAGIMAVHPSSSTEQDNRLDTRMHTDHDLSVHENHEEQFINTLESYLRKIHAEQKNQLPRWALWV